MIKWPIGVIYIPQAIFFMVKLKSILFLFSKYASCHCFGTLCEVFYCVVHPSFRNTMIKYFCKCLNNK